MKHYFLGLAANYSRRQRLAHTFAIGQQKDCDELKKFLAEKYQGKAVLTKNGRSALAMALKAYFEPGDEIIVNGFTCYAVYEAIKAAGLIPVFVDIDKNSLNFDSESLQQILRASHAVVASPTSSKDSVGDRPAQSPAREKIRGIIVQNTFGNPVDIGAIEKFAKKHSLTIVEDLAHCAGVKYADGREAGTIGAATILSFGKDKSIDTISGGAVVLRERIQKTSEMHGDFPKIKEPYLKPKISDALRARFYPLFGAIARGLSYIRLSGPWMGLLIKIHWVEKSADNKLDLNRKISKFEAKMALKQLQKLKKSGEGKIREFYLVKNQDEVLKELKKAGYYFDGFWYERPVSPERYYKKVHFPENECPTSVEVTKKIINFPSHYTKQELAPALKIVKDYLEDK
ncbi:DegT/DnrJ/EryC1/StrS aminotransferase family protein [Candidatus Saccharibacteria bacterium]|nr:DegT/DnrJ/EryC1/StrS aminotransferase family protein [Candidatus Saccharibacteria bacterium]